MFAVINRDLFKNDLELCSRPIVDVETGKVSEDMEKLANSISVVRLQTVSDMDEVHIVALLNVGLEEKV